jgi:hypothetical protein
VTTRANHGTPGLPGGVIAVDAGVRPRWQAGGRSMTRSGASAISAEGGACQL